MNRQFLRRILALTFAAATLWTALVTGESRTFRDATLAATDSFHAAKRILRWELGDFFGTDLLTAVNVLALQQSPLLLQQRSAIVPLMMLALQQNVSSADTEVITPQESTQDATPPAAVSTEGLTFAPNGVPSQTVVPTSTKGYTVVGNAYIKNSSSRTMDAQQLAEGNYSAKLGTEGPQVLIIHSHATEAYTMPEGQEYDPSGTYRTHDTAYNMVRVGDEVASVLSGYGISVLHDRALHDAASYNDAYNKSYASIVSYLEKYPTISYVLDIHRDAIQDTNGNQYKLIAREEPRLAQCCLVMGVAHDGWTDNLQLAVAVQQQLLALSPTLMRPITARGYRYNQQLSPGSLLVEIGAAGNSLDEALLAARYFATGFANTILAET